MGLGGGMAPGRGGGGEVGLADGEEVGVEGGDVVVLGSGLVRGWGGVDEVRKVLFCMLL